MPETVMVTGGAGYVGSHVCLMLAQRGYRPVAVDDLSTSRASAAQFGPLEIADVTTGALPELMRSYAPSAVVHAAAKASVGESFNDPQLYRHVNVTGTRNVIDACREHGVRRLIFISTASVYGSAMTDPIDESAATQPTSPYGCTKLEAEREWLSASGAGLGATVLRLFNVAGAAVGQAIGEDRPVETHLVPLAIRAALGRGAPLQLFGGRYATRDATPLRDYVHVLDVASAVHDALRYLTAGGTEPVFNIGSGVGTSVLEVVAAVERAVGRPVPVMAAAARAGDPAVLIANPALARRLLGFRHSRSAIDEIVRDALHWEQFRSGRQLKRHADE